MQRSVSLSRSTYLIACGCVAFVVWSIWVSSLGSTAAVSAIIDNWQAAVTMIFGSFVAGSTAAGGGAVAFPVLTKVLGVSSVDAKLFSLAIQSVGMTSASIVILWLRIPVYWRAISWCSLGGVGGIVLGLFVLAPTIPSIETKILFTAIQVGFSIVLLSTLKNRDLADYEQYISPAVLLIAGFSGGVASGVVGSGIDLIVFSVLVLVAGISEKLATPTSVVIMATNSLIAMLAIRLWSGELPSKVVEMWLAAVPVVVVGAPVGAIFCSFLSRKTIAKALVTLILIEATSTCFLIPLRLPTMLLALCATSLSLAAFAFMSRNQISDNAFSALDVEQTD